MGDFSEFNSAQRLTLAMEKVAARVVNRIVPPPRFAEVTAVDLAARTVTVQYPDEPGNDITLPCHTAMPKDVGSTVRVSGPRGGRFVDEVIGGDVHFNSLSAGSFELHNDGPLFQSGVDSVTTNADGRVTVTFPIAFSSDPVVVFTPDFASNAEWSYHHRTDPTTTGFTVQITKDGSAVSSGVSVKMHWIAAQEH